MTEPHGRTTRSARGAAQTAPPPDEPRAPPPDEPRNVSESLARYCVLEWDVPINNIRITENSRQTSDAAVARFVESIKADGWSTGSYPKLMFTTLGPDTPMTDELAKSLKAVVIDGNHRRVNKP